VVISIQIRENWLMIVGIHVIPPKTAKMKVWRKFTNKTINKDP
jgi:hypothetical protein